MSVRPRPRGRRHCSLRSRRRERARGDGMAVQGIVVNRLRALLTMLGITDRGRRRDHPRRGRQRLRRRRPEADRGARHEHRHRPARRLRLRPRIRRVPELVHAAHAEGRQGPSRPDGRARHQVGDARRQRTRRLQPSGRRATRRTSSSARRRRTPRREDARSKPGRSSRRADETAHNRVVVLGQTVVTNLFGNQDPLGQTIKLNGIGFEVVGVLAAEGNERLHRSGRHRDGDR